MPTTSFSKKLLSWYDQHGRHDLPWQQDKTPYPTWVSEIMLQQTQVKTVIPYFQRFIARFPTIEALAKAELDEVLHLWTGLGYYSRARNLHKTAQIICQQQGQWPNSIEELEKLPGIGRSTAGAIFTIAMQGYAPILDGNVKRVLTRYYAIQTWPGHSQAQKELWRLALENTPRKRTADYTQAIMDLGATLCRRSRPQCDTCPLNQSCQAFELGLSNQLPRPKPKKELPIKQTLMLVIQNDKGETLLQQNPPTGIWGSLWCLPQIESLSQAENSIGLSLEPSHISSMAPMRHSFSHFHLDITPLRVNTTNFHSLKETRPICWYNPENPPAIGLAAPIKKILSAVY